MVDYDDLEEGMLVRLVREPQGHWPEGLRQHAGRILEIIMLDGGDVYVIDSRGFEWTIGENDIEEIVDEFDPEKPVKEEVERVTKDYPDVVFLPKDVEAIANEIFGEDRVCMDAEKFEEYGSYGVVIHFPELHLTNSKEQKHFIKDLYTRFDVKIRFDAFGSSNYKANIDFLGCRTHVSLKEYRCGYAHSHLPTDGSYNMNPFCLGSSQFGFMLSNLKENMMDEDWRMVFYSLERYLNWESLEGGPHYCMKNIDYRADGQSNLLTLLKPEADRLLSGIPEECWEYINGEIELIRGSRVLYQYLNEKAIIRGGDELLLRKRVEWLEEAKARANMLDKLVWKGTGIPLTVVDDPIAETVEVKPLSRDVVDVFCNLLEIKSKSFIKEYIHERRKDNYKERVFRAA